MEDWKMGLRCHEGRKMSRSDDEIGRDREQGSVRPQENLDWHLTVGWERA